MGAKIQASVEFIILLAAIAAFGTFVLGIYAHFFLIQKASYAGLANQITNMTPNLNHNGSKVQGGPELYLNVPSTTFVNKSNAMQIIFILPNSARLSVIPNATGMLFIPKAYYNVSYGNLGILTFSAIPENGGYKEITADTTVTEGNVIYDENLSAETYALVNNTPSQPGNAPLGFYATLNHRNETALFELSHPNYTYSITSSSHCSYENFWGQQLDIRSQCGNAKWYFFMFSDVCYWDYGIETATYCIYETPTGVSYYTIGEQEGYEYNISLILEGGDGVRLQSNLSSEENESEITSNGTIYGHANVYGDILGYIPNQYYDYIVVNDSDGYSIVNNSGYLPYLQALNNLNSVMGYYNNSGVGADGDLSMGQTVSSYTALS